MTLRIALLGVLLGLGPVALSHGAWSDPLAQEIAAMKERGYTAQQHLSAREGKKRLMVVLYRFLSEPTHNRLKIYEVQGKKARTVYIEPSAAASITFNPAHRDNDLPRLFKGRARFLIYDKTLPGIKSKSSRILLYEGEWKAVASLPDVVLQDIDRDGTPEIISKSQPLGPFVLVECRAFYSMSKRVDQTTIYRWENGSLVRASGKYAEFYAANIDRLEQELSANVPKKPEDYGQALGMALSIYFDYTEQGDQRRGWNRLLQLLSPKGQSAPAAKCLRIIQDDLRSRLKIPENWNDDSL